MIQQAPTLAARVAVAITVTAALVVINAVLCHSLLTRQAAVVEQELATLEERVRAPEIAEVRERVRDVSGRGTGILVMTTLVSLGMAALLGFLLYRQTAAAAGGADPVIKQALIQLRATLDDTIRRM